MENANIPLPMMLAFSMQLHSLAAHNSRRLAQRTHLLEGMQIIALKNLMASLQGEEIGKSEHLEKEGKKYLALMEEFSKIVTPEEHIRDAASFIAEKIVTEMFAGYVINGMTEGVRSCLKAGPIGYDLLSVPKNNSNWQAFLPENVNLYTTWELTKEGYVAFSVYDVVHKDKAECDKARRFDSLDKLPENAAHALRFEFVESGDPSLSKKIGIKQDGFIGFRLRSDLENPKLTRKAMSDIAKVCALVLTPDKDVAQGLGLSYHAIKEMRDSTGRTVTEEDIEIFDADDPDAHVNDNTPYPVIKPVEAPEPRPDSVKFDSADDFLASLFKKPESPKEPPTETS